MPSAEIEFDELRIEIAPKVYLPVGIIGSANFEFDHYGNLENIDGISLSVEGKQKQFWLKPENPLFKQIKSALERDCADRAWDETGETIKSNYEEHSTLFTSAQL